jgi:hypothetical protein
VNDYKGHITREHTIWCGGCAQWTTEAVDTRAALAKISRKRGWKKTKDHGWVCHACVIKLGLKPKPAIKEY